MSMTTVEIQVPEEIARFAAPGDDKSVFARNAMIIWPFIRNGTVYNGPKILDTKSIDFLSDDRGQSFRGGSNEKESAYSD